MYRRSSISPCYSFPFIIFQNLLAVALGKNVNEIVTHCELWFYILAENRKDNKRKGRTAEGDQHSRAGDHTFEAANGDSGERADSPKRAF